MVILPQIKKCKFFRRYDRKFEPYSETYRSFVHNIATGAVKSLLHSTARNQLKSPAICDTMNSMRNAWVWE